MNRVMWDDPSTQQNCSALSAKGWIQLGPASGIQACGESGEGRMLEVNDIIGALYRNLRTGELQGLNVTITAGPTYEAIDPVRYIGNRSSGRMGYAMAAAAQEAGADVILISGPSHLPVPEKVSFIAVESASEMQQAVMSSIQNCHIYISAAAISDYRVDEVASQKIKKTEDTMTLYLVKNDDILLGVTRSPSRPFVVGFAAETENLVQNAKDKLLRKNLDMIAANDVSNSSDIGPSGSIPAIGFNSEHNALHVFWNTQASAEAATDSDQNHAVQIEQQIFDIARKTQLAKKLISLIAKIYKSSQKTNQTMSQAANEKDTA
jgi:phosphopantothenoylcysteine decarboxylase/phosphopantothenate--cysteine ligase